MNLHTKPERWAPAWRPSTQEGRVGSRVARGTLLDSSIADNTQFPFRMEQPVSCNGRRIKTFLFAALSALCAAIPYAAAAAGPDPLVVQGSQLARIDCSRCHVVSPDQDFPPQLQVSAPSFEAIANRRTSSAESLRHFISTTHWDGQTIPITMPAPALTKQETAALVAYILSLRKPVDH